MKRFIYAVFLTTLIIETSGCGTLLYPERKNQGQGKLDIGVVALDGIGLLFFIIPGVIAYAVDFNNDTIYLPKGRTGLASNDLNKADMVAVHVDNLSAENIRKVVYTQTGQNIPGDAKVEVYKIGANGQKIPANSYGSL